jgi:hypothetical protein
MGRKSESEIWSMRVIVFGQQHFNIGKFVKFYPLKFFTTLVPKYFKAQPNVQQKVFMQIGKFCKTRKKLN